MPTIKAKNWSDGHYRPSKTKKCQSQQKYISEPTNSEAKTNFKKLRLIDSSDSTNEYRRYLQYGLLYAMSIELDFGV